VIERGKVFLADELRKLRVGLEVRGAQRREAHEVELGLHADAGDQLAVLSIRRTLVELELSMSSLRTEFIAQ
jgi:hypothetical protein